MYVILLYNIVVELKILFHWVYTNLHKMPSTVMYKDLDRRYIIFQEIKILMGNNKMFLDILKLAREKIHWHFD